MNGHCELLVVDILSDPECRHCWHARRSFNQALEDFTDKHLVRINVMPYSLALRPAATLPAAMPLFVFNHGFYLSGMHTERRFGNALAGMVVQSRAAVPLAQGFPCSLNASLV